MILLLMFSCFVCVLSLVFERDSAGASYHISTLVPICHSPLVRKQLLKIWTVALTWNMQVWKLQLENDRQFI